MSHVLPLVPQKKQLRRRVCVANAAHPTDVGFHSLGVVNVVDTTTLSHVSRFSLASTGSGTL